MKLGSTTKKILWGAKNANIRAIEKSKISRSLEEMSESLGKIDHTKKEIDAISEKADELYERVSNIGSKTLHSRFVEINKRRKYLLLFYSRF